MCLVELMTRPYVAVCCSVLQCVAVCCSVLQCAAVCWSILQGVAVCCSVLQCAEVYRFHIMRLVDRVTRSCVAVLQCVAVCCSVLQCLAVCCSVLQYVAVCCSVLHCVALCCTVLQCVAVCCSVLQCVAVYYTDVAEYAISSQFVLLYTNFGPDHRERFLCRWFYLASCFVGFFCFGVSFSSFLGIPTMSFQ